MKTPVWGDGNDVASLPDSVIRAGNRTGWVWTQHSIPVEFVTERDTGCYPNPAERPTRSMYCPDALGLFGIEVIVK